MTKPRLIRDVWDAILNDSWMWVVVWGVQRCGKTTLTMQIAYEVYKDWDKVLESFVFNLSGLLYKIDRGEPECIMTRNKLHNRVPLLQFDDWGGSSNKAATQHNQAWDQFKGGFDLIGTELSTLFASMVDPTEPTMQLMNKYTHEVWIKKRGVYKYDKVEWQQDFYGWNPRKSKTFIEENTFEPVPRDVYVEYDEVRMALVQEMKARIRDTQASEQIPWIIKRLMPIDIHLLEILRQRGMLSYDWFRPRDHYKEALVRGKARDLIVPIRKGSVYYYDLTNLGLDVLTVLGEEDKLGKYEKQKAPKTQRTQRHS